MKTNTYAVLYPFGTGSRSYKLFADSEEAKKFLDAESNHTGIVLPDGTLTIGIIAGMTTAEVEDAIISNHVDAGADAEDVLTSLFAESENVEHWRLTEDEDGTWSDEADTYATREEGEEYNAPSQYLINF